MLYMPAIYDATHTHATEDSSDVDENQGKAETLVDAPRDLAYVGR